MELKQLKYFLHVAELGSYTRAAEFLNVAQPILSRQIRQLETELRRNLLIRHGRGVQLTEAGTTLLHHTRLILQQLERTREDLSLSSGNITGRITLGLPPTISRLISVDLIKQFRAELPHASLGIIEGLTAHLQESLQLGRLQISLLNNPPYNADLSTRLLHREHLSLITPADDPLSDSRTLITADRLATLPLIMPRAPNTFRVLLEREMARLNQKPNVVQEIDSIETTLELVAEHMGYAILSSRAVSGLRHRRSLAAVPLKNPMLENHLFLATSAKQARTRLQNELMRIIGSVCAEYFPPVADTSIG